MQQLPNTRIPNMLEIIIQQFNTYVNKNFIKSKRKKHSTILICSSKIHRSMHQLIDHRNQKERYRCIKISRTIFSLLISSFYHEISPSMALSIARIHFGKKNESFESKYCRYSTIKKKWQIMGDNGRTMGRTREFLTACEISSKKSDL